MSVYRVAINSVFVVLVDVILAWAEQERKSYSLIKNRMALLKADEVKLLAFICFNVYMSSKRKQVHQSKTDHNRSTYCTFSESH